jgi:hypothetical protein
MYLKKCIHRVRWKGPLMGTSMAEVLPPGRLQKCFRLLAVLCVGFTFPWLSNTSMKNAILDMVVHIPHKIPGATIPIKVNDVMSATRRWLIHLSRLPDELCDIQAAMRRWQHDRTSLIRDITAPDRPVHTTGLLSPRPRLIQQGSERDCMYETGRHKS